MAGGERERERRTCNQCCVASHGQRMADSMCFNELKHTTFLVPDAARSLARRDVDPAQGEWFQRVACGGAQGGCGSLVGETTLRTAGREGEGFAQGGEDGGPRGRGLMFGHTNAPPQSFKASSSLPRPYKDDEGMVGSARET